MISAGEDKTPALSVGDTPAPPTLDLPMPKPPQRPQPPKEGNLDS